MAYATLVTIEQDLQEIFESIDGLPRLLYPIQTLLDFLLRSSSMRRIKAVRDLETEIRDVAYQVQDVVDLFISNYQYPDGRRYYLDRIVQIWTHQLPPLVEQIEHLPTPQPQAPMPFRYGGSGEDCQKKLIGLEEDIQKLRIRIIGHAKEREVIAIVGMGGSGKTTLARKLYQDWALNHHFDVVVWVTLSQEYDIREIMLWLLDSIGILTPAMREQDNILLNKHLYQHLWNKRHLVVMDDLWSEDAFDAVKMMLPNDRKNGSRIMITTRLSEVAIYAIWGRGYLHRMRLLSEEESCALLCTRTFDDANCPDFLMEVCKKIALSCKGLPLAVEVISGCLKHKDRERFVWEEVASKINSNLRASDLMRGMVRFSYDDLPHYLKAYFLYLGMFAEDEEIVIYDILKLWEAEGILTQMKLVNPEQVTAISLEQLAFRNLVMPTFVAGRLASCRIHDVLRDVCLEIAKEEQFLAAIHADSDIQQQDIKLPRRLAIHGGDLRKNVSSSCSIIAPENLLLLRSFRCKIQLNIDDDDDDSSSYLNCFQLLRVLELPTMDFFGHQVDMMRLSNLRYLSVSVKKWSIPEHFADYFWNLQTLIMVEAFVKGTHVLWRMPTLKHICFYSCDMKCPEDKRLKLPRLETLSYIKLHNCSPELFLGAPNLRSLGIRKVDSSVNVIPVDPHRILPKLEMLRFECHVSFPSSLLTDSTLPKSLKRLTLSNTRLPWKSMSVVGKLPNLQELRLFYDACIGGTWETREGEFQQLEHLKIGVSSLRHWETSDDHFPKLHHLVLWDCFLLEEIPPCFQEISAIRFINVNCASPSAATKAQEQVEKFRESGIRIVISGSITTASRLERQMRSLVVAVEDVEVEQGLNPLMERQLLRCSRRLLVPFLPELALRLIFPAWQTSSAWLLPYMFFLVSRFRAIFWYNFGLVHLAVTYLLSKSGKRMSCNMTLARDVFIMHLYLYLFNSTTTKLNFSDTDVSSLDL